jgi:ribosomal protein S18 acetylase RimI-like enzyme
MPFSLRPAAPADLPAIHALNRRIEINDKIPLVTPLEEFEDWIDDPHLDFPRHTRVAVRNGDIVGYGRLWHRPSDTKESRVFLMGGVDPRHRQRGIGSALLAWQIEAGRELLSASPPELKRYLRTMAYDFEQEAIALYEKHGLRAIRYYDELLRPLDHLLGVTPIPGIELRPWDPERTEELRKTYNEAFADHWGSTPLDEEAWAHRLGASGTRTDLSWIALAGDEVVGLTLNAHYPADQELTGRIDGWIMGLGTDRQFRKRGIASALVMQSCHTFRQQGFTHAALGVDSASPTGADRIYRRLGFESMHRSIQHQMEV